MDTVIYRFAAVSARARRAVERSGGTVFARARRRGVVVALPASANWFPGLVVVEGGRARVEDTEFEDIEVRSTAFTWACGGGAAALAADSARRLWHWRDAQCPKRESRAEVCA